MKEFSTEKMCNIFEKTFKEKAENEKIESLIDMFGGNIVSQVFGYILINGVKSPVPGRRNNPYGLIYKICKDFDNQIEN
jgi:hypothetical protein